MANDTKTDETKTSEDVVAAPPATEPTVETTPPPATTGEGQIDHKFFKRIQWGLTAATVFCAAAGVTAAHFENKERAAQTAPAAAVAPAVTAAPVTPLVRAPG